jgi:phosphoenolpyruvate carboxylase
MEELIMFANDIIKQMIDLKIWEDESFNKKFVYNLLNEIYLLNIEVQKKTKVIECLIDEKNTYKNKLKQLHCDMNCIYDVVNKLQQPFNELKGNFNNTENFLKNQYLLFDFLTPNKNENISDDELQDVCREIKEIGKKYAKL